MKNIMTVLGYCAVISGCGKVDTTATKPAESAAAVPAASSVAAPAPAEAAPPPASSASSEAVKK